jgi:hypothetical protein
MALEQMEGFELAGRTVSGSGHTVSVGFKHKYAASC